MRSGLSGAAFSPLTGGDQNLVSAYHRGMGENNEKALLSAMVTGSNRGIGLEFCRFLAMQGWRVWALCRQSSEELKELAGQFEQVNIVEGAEITSQVKVQALMEELKQAHGGSPFLDLVINNAGSLIKDTFEDLEQGNLNPLRQQFEVNVLGQIILTMNALPLMRPHAKVAMISSRMGSCGETKFGGYYGYKISKAGLNMLSNILAADLIRKQIYLGIYHPGYVKTEMTGYQGDLTASESVDLCMKLIDKLDYTQTGKFFHVKGHQIAW
jgi:NAD(P)-dependent dehydrogenase (short-subunit alcohol dehydrogenase family)